MVLAQRYTQPKNQNNKLKPLLIAVAVILLAATAVGLAIKLLPKSVGIINKPQINFDSSVTDAEKLQIAESIGDKLNTNLDISAKTVTEPTSQSEILSAYVPVMNFYSSKQDISIDEIPASKVAVLEPTDDTITTALAELLGIDTNAFTRIPNISNIEANLIVFIPSNQLNPSVKLLRLNGDYYLDSFTKGALFRQVSIKESAPQNVAYNQLVNKDTVLKVNMTGVTALTRSFMRDSNVNNPTHYSDKIAPLLKDADISHTSNEVSFKDPCSYHNASFCSPSQFIDTLKASGFNLIELTGNHNNDVGNEYNKQTIELYQSLGWNVFGGGINAEEAAKPYIADKKESKVAFLGYNYADTPGSGAIAGATNAGANGFDYVKIEQDIKDAKEQAGFVIVDIQYWECYSYPDGYIEFPECDAPISGQQEVFRKVADLGANMVIGSQAHQPQTYEIYNDSYIWYGLGNIYFEQNQWPGTERSLVLTHYFNKGGELIQTKITPTVYDKNLQPDIMDNDTAEYLLNRLIKASPL